MRKAGWFFPAILLAMGWTTAAGALDPEPFVLVASREPRAVIRISSEAGETEQAAAEVLRKTIARMSGAELPILEDDGDEPPEAASIFVGKHPLLPDAIATRLNHGTALIFSDPRRDAYGIEVRKDAIYLVGRRERGTLYAVYDLLESLGCRWFFACPAGEIIPERATLRLDPFRRYETPDFAVRWQYTWHGTYRTPTTWRREEQWCAANRLHFAGGASGLIKGYSGHNFGSIWPGTLYDEHPEYFPLLRREPPVYVTTKIPAAPTGDAVFEGNASAGGAIVLDPTPKPDRKATDRPPPIRWNPGWGGSWQPCLSNPGVIKLGLQWAEQTLAKHPDFDVVTFAPNDGYGHCQCADCARVGNIADNNLNLANQIGKELFKKHPDKMIHIWAYAGGAQIPRIRADGYAENRDRVLVNIMRQFSPTPFHELIEGWGKASHHLCISRPWYWYHEKWIPAAYPCSYRSEIEKYPFYVSNNVSIIECQIKGDWGKIGFDRYLAAKAMWNSDLDIDACARDFAEKMFPSGSPFFYDFLELNWGLPGKSRETLHSFMTTALPLFQSIRERISTPDERERWEFYALFLYAQYLDDRLYKALAGKNNPRERYDAHYAIVSFLKGTEARGIFESSQRIPVIHYPSLRRYGEILRAQREIEAAGHAPDATLTDEPPGADEVLAMLDLAPPDAPAKDAAAEDALIGFDKNDKHCRYVKPLVCDSPTVDRLFDTCREHFLQGAPLDPEDHPGP